MRENAFYNSEIEEQVKRGKRALGITLARTNRDINKAIEKLAGINRERELTLMALEEIEKRRRRLAILEKNKCDGKHKTVEELVACEGCKEILE